MSVRVQETDFDLGAEITALRAGRPSIGMVASFIGTARGINDGTGVSEMELECYPDITEEALVDITSAAMQRQELIGALVIHRVDRLKLQDQIVLVAIAPKHRGESFTTCGFIMDYPKNEASFWKKERVPEGARQVDARVTDDKALARWGIASNSAASNTADQPGVSAQPNDYG